MAPSTTETPITGFTGYTVVTDLDKARDIMCFGLSTFFDNKNKYKYGKEYLKYIVWNKKNINPSHKSVYNFIKHNTPLSDPQKNILFTLTNKHIFYRFKDTYYQPLITQMEEKPKSTEIIEETTALAETNPETQLHSEKQPEIPETINVQESPQTPTNSKPTDNTAESYDTLKSVIRNIDEDVDDGLQSANQSTNKQNDDASNTMETFMKNMEAQMDILNNKITNFMETTTRNVSTITSNYNDKIEAIKDTTDKKIAELNTAKEDYRNACDKIKSRTTFIEKQINLIEKKINFMDNDLETIIEKKINQHILTHTLKFNDCIEEAEQDVTATLMSFQDHVKTATSAVDKPEDPHLTQKTVTEATDLITAMKHQMEELTNLTQKWNFQQADIDLDTLLMAKLRDFDENTSAQISDLREIQKETERLLHISKRDHTPPITPQYHRNTAHEPEQRASLQKPVPANANISQQAPATRNNDSSRETKNIFFYKDIDGAPDQNLRTYDRTGTKNTHGHSNDFKSYGQEHTSAQYSTNHYARGTTHKPSTQDIHSTSTTIPPALAHRMDNIKNTV